MAVVLPKSTIRTPGLPGYYQDKHKYCHLKGAVLKTDCFVSAPVSFDSSDGKLFMPSAAGTTIMGVAVKNDWNRLEVEPDDSGNDQYERFYIPSGKVPYIMVEGEQTMYAEKPITVMNGQVYYRHTADGANTRLYTVSDTAGTGLEALGNCRFVELSSAPGIVWVEIRL